MFQHRSLFLLKNLKMISYLLKHVVLEEIWRIVQINHQPGATIFQSTILTFIYSSACFGHSPIHHQELSDCSGSLWFYLCIVVIAVLCSWSDPTTNSARLSPLMMGGRTPETCWAVNKRQDSRLEICCIWLVIYLNCTMMHRLTNLKWRIVSDENYTC